MYQKRIRCHRVELLLVTLWLLVQSTLACAGSVIVPADITLDLVTAGLERPIAVRHAGDDSGRLFIVEQSGRIRIWDGNQLLSTPFLDLTDLTTASGERGFLGLDFHPDYSNNGRFFVNFTADGIADIPEGTTVIAEYQVSTTDPNIADSSSRRIVMTVRQDFANHNGGDIHFGPDGMLYIGMGDGGDGGDPCDRSQTLDPNNIMANDFCIDDPSVALLGKMLRIDINNTTPAGSNELCAANSDGSAEYSIPASNPFASSDSICDEVWAYGLRNPFRFSFDRNNGDLWIGDVGEDLWEEIDLQPAGAVAGVNYGWNECEGLHPQGDSDPNSICAFSSELPVLEYSHADGSCSVAGGYRYRGPVSSLNGTYLYGDFCSNTIWFAQETAPGVWESVISGFSVSQLAAFGEAQDGTLYALSVTDGEMFVFNGNENIILFDGFETTF